MKLTVIIFITGAIFVRALFFFRMSSRFYSVDTVDKMPWGIVFGAGLYRPDRTCSCALLERLDKAAELYHAGIVKKLLLSGACTDILYNEPEAMRLYLEDQGIPREAMILDPDGLRSLQTLKNARDKYGIRAAILITQRFHMPRCLLLSDAVGIRAEGIPTHHRRHMIDDRILWEIRETFATFRAFYDAAREQVNRS